MVVNSINTVRVLPNVFRLSKTVKSPHPMVNSGSKWGRVVSESLCVLTSFSFFLAGYFAIVAIEATNILIRRITHAMTQTHSGNATPLTKLIEYSISKNTISFLSNCTVTLVAV